MASDPTSTLFLVSPPYSGIRPYEAEGRQGLGTFESRAGAAVVWQMSRRVNPRHMSSVVQRPGGVSLIVLLPPSKYLAEDPTIWQAVSRSRPQAILPYHGIPDVEDLCQVLRKPPEDVPAAVTDYLRWRGIRIDLDTTRLVRRTLALSAEVTSVAALSRGLYLSRRALGRRFATRGLPVPSHWLQFGRVLRFALRLQNTNGSVYSVALGLGYPDGFSASNQMHRLTGFRPSELRERLGWEWVLEAWLRREAEAGGLAPEAPSDAPPVDADAGDATQYRKRAAS